MREPIVEICCGSFYDALQAAEGGAKRIELNSALMLGGLPPGTATLKLVKQNIPDLKVITMVRPRGAGFCYSKEELASTLEYYQNTVKVTDENGNETENVEQAVNVKTTYLSKENGEDNLWPI